MADGNVENDTTYIPEGEGDVVEGIKEVHYDYVENGKEEDLLANLGDKEKIESSTQLEEKLAVKLFDELYEMLYKNGSQELWKNGELGGLKVTAVEGNLRIKDTTADHEYSVYLSYDKDKKSFNLKEINNGKVSRVNDIEPSYIVNFLHDIQRKIHEADITVSKDVVDETANQTESIMSIINDNPKRGLFRRK